MRRFDGVIEVRYITLQNASFRMRDWDRLVFHLCLSELDYFFECASVYGEMVGDHLSLSVNESGIETDLM